MEMTITLETDGFWGSQAIAKYLDRSHHYPVLVELKAGRIAGAKCVAGRWFASRAALDSYKASYVDGRTERRKRAAA